MDKYTKICRHCGIQFSDKKHPNKIYCSKACWLATAVETRVCLGCKTEFVSRKGQPHKYCSSACGFKNRPKPEVKAQKTCVCEQCGIEFQTWNSRPGRFCSHLCMSKFAARQPKPNLRRPENFRTIYCEVCSKEYVVHVAQLNGRNSRFCSNTCRGIAKSEAMKGAGNPNYIGGTRFPNRGSSWSKQRKLALVRDGYKCQICGLKKKKKGDRLVSVHHITPYKHFNGNHLVANQLSNLITLCRKCHNRVEDHNYPCPRPLL